MREFGHFIDGAWLPPSSGRHLDCVDPCTGLTWARVARGNAEDAGHAVSAAQAAFERSSWRREPGRRVDALEALADRLETGWQTLVEPEVRGNGKPVGEVKAQFGALHFWYRHVASELRRADGDGTALANSVPGVGTELRREPFGTVVAITPWNSPLMILAWKLAPALAAGNAVVVKPSEHASVSTLLFAEMAAGEPVPDGIVNVVTGFGREVGDLLVRHPLIRMVSFTGSGNGGRSVAKAAAESEGGPIPVVLELGGKSPQIVFADADLEAAVNGIMSGIFLSGGQTCVAGSRLIAEAAIHDSLVERLCARAAALRVGDPMDPETDIGPLANRPHHARVLEMIRAARSEGAVCVSGGGPVHVAARPSGLFIGPTIFTGVGCGMALWREEVFGPVLAVASFSGEDEALELANDTEYGLAAGVWTSDMSRARRMADRLAAGTVYVNHYRSVDPNVPVGGFGASGHGRELGPDSIRRYQQMKSVWTGSAPVADPFKRR